MVRKFPSGGDDQRTSVAYVKIHCDDERFLPSLVGFLSSSQLLLSSEVTTTFARLTCALVSFFMIPWDIPTSDEEIPRLTHIYRNQHFLVWLAAMDLESKVKEHLSSRPWYCTNVCFACQFERTSTSFVLSSGRRSSRLPWSPKGSEVADRYWSLIHLLSNQSSTMRTCPFQRVHSTHPQVSLRRIGRNNFT